MSVIRFEPFRDPFREFDRLMSMAASGTRAPLGMPMDVYRGQDGAYHVEADLPGVDPDRVEVTVEHSVLTIRAERAPHYGEGDQVIAAERPQGSFTRQLSLGEGVDAEHLTAGLRRRCAARDHSRVTEGAGPPGGGHPCGRRRPHHLGEHCGAGCGAPWGHQWGRLLNRLRTPQQYSAVAENTCAGTPARSRPPGTLRGPAH